MRLFVSFLAAVVAALVGLRCAPGLAQECRRLPPVMEEAGSSVVAPAEWLQPTVHDVTGGADFATQADAGVAEIGERLIDKATDPFSRMMGFMVRDEIGVPLDTEDGELNQLDFRAQVPFDAFGKFNAARVEVQYNINSSDGDGLYDVMLFDMVVTKTSWGKWGIGPSISMVPNSSSNGSTFQAGPAAGVISITEHWTIGLLTQNYLSSQYCQTDIEPLLTYKFNETTWLSLGDIKFEYDWTNGHWIQVPLGIELARIVDIAGQKIDFFVNPQYNLRNSDGNQEWQFYFGFTLLLPEDKR
ncbi:MAG: hypothetical protein K8T91_20615 [Planctomycetes bacterium]|nr:hypothetical protein [Planctomycetota bacterium]